MNNDTDNNTSIKHTLFHQIETEITAQPVQLCTIKKLIEHIADGLCMFVPSKEAIHKRIRDDINPGVVDAQTPHLLVERLIFWIKQFQSPVHDTTVDNMMSRLRSYNGENYANGLVTFLREYCEHIEQCYKETWEARKRLVRGESVVPPEHRLVVKGENCVPTNMKTGRNV